MTYSGRLQCIRLQASAPTVAGPITYGCRRERLEKEARDTQHMLESRAQTLRSRAAQLAQSEANEVCTCIHAYMYACTCTCACACACRLLSACVCVYLWTNRVTYAPYMFTCAYA